MFGLEDKLFVRSIRYGKAETNFDRNSVIKVRNGAQSNQLWIGIFPSLVYDRERLRKGAFPDGVETISYRLPKDTITPNPIEIKQVLENFYKDAQEAIEFSNRFPTDISLLGISLGGTIAFKLANHFQIGQLLCVAPGANLPECIRDGIATKSLFERSRELGYSLSDFRDQLDEYSPINNLDNLSEVGRILLYLGFWDQMIPYQDGARLVRSMRDLGLTPQITKRYFYGHGLTITRFRYEPPKT